MLVTKLKIESDVMLVTKLQMERDVSHEVADGEGC